MRTAVTLCRVPEAAGGPFVFHQDLEDGFASAARHGFDAVELFLPGPEAYPVGQIHALQSTYGLDVAAVGTGAGMLKHGLTLTDPDPARRQAALEFILAMTDFGGQLQAPVIIGSMQGKAVGDVSRDQALAWLAEALKTLAETADRHGLPVVYEPLNRYETNLHNRIGEATDWLGSHDLGNVVLLADLFHMNIEEVNVVDAVRAGGDRIGHVHFADSNRSAMGLGHTDAAAVVNALSEIGYQGYLSAEILPLPDPEAAAAQTLRLIQSLTP